MLISDWSSDVCSSDLYNWHPMRRRLSPKAAQQRAGEQAYGEGLVQCTCRIVLMTRYVWTAIGSRHSTVSLHRAQTRPPGHAEWNSKSEEHTSELQSLMRSSYAVFCLTKQNQ